MDKYRLFIKTKIHFLTYQKKILLCLLLSERLIENYDFFSKRYNYGNVNILKKTIDDLFSEVESNISRYNVEDLISKIEEVTPDTEDYETIYVSFALDACTSIISTLQYINDKNDDNVVDVVLYSRDTVDMFIQEKDDLNLSPIEVNEYIEKDIFMKNEKKYQAELIEYLQRTDDLSFNEISLLRATTKNPIDLNLLD
jgi:uncharacterized protein YjaG (DUF416 family)